MGHVGRIRYPPQWVPNSAGGSQLWVCLDSVRLVAANGPRGGRWEPLSLRVNPAAHAAEIRRFLSKVVVGPGLQDCAILLGAAHDVVHTDTRGLWEQ
jgi:hypothetical protein